MRENLSLAAALRREGNGRHRHCQGDFEKATTASTKIACSDVAIVEGNADGGRGDREGILAPSPWPEK